MARTRTTNTSLACSNNGSSFSNAAAAEIEDTSLSSSPSSNPTSCAGTTSHEQYEQQLQQHHHHHHHHQQQRGGKEEDDEERVSFLPPPSTKCSSSSSDSYSCPLASSGDHHYNQHKKSTKWSIIYLLTLIREAISLVSLLLFPLQPSSKSSSNSIRKGTRQQTAFACSLRVFLSFIFAIFVIEKSIFCVRYITMGRPRFLYGLPVEWESVKGCLVQTYRQELKDYKTQATMTATHVPLNPNVVWKWYRYSNAATTKTTTKNKSPERKLLIAQFSGFGPYSQMLEQVEPINRAYARKWGHDYVTLQGSALAFPGMKRSTEYHAAKDSVLKGQNDKHEEESNSKLDENHENDDQTCPSLENGYEVQSAFNKIPLLMKALDLSSPANHAMQLQNSVLENQKYLGEDHVDRNFSSFYDQVLILDSDTMIVDFDFDITTLLLPLKKQQTQQGQTQANQQQQHGDSMGTASNEYFLAAYRVFRNDWHWTWEINNGITLWNLNHPTTRTVAEAWLKGSLTHPKDVLLKNDDQFFLQRALMSLGWWTRMRHGVRALRDEFDYYDATLIKHFKRDAQSWTRTSLEQRLFRIQEAKAAVCEEWAEECADVLQEMTGDVSTGKS